jgi:hypothetical protein
VIKFQLTDYPVIVSLDETDPHESSEIIYEGPDEAVAAVKEMLRYHGMWHPMGNVTSTILDLHGALVNRSQIILGAELVPDEASLDGIIPEGANP